MIHVRLAALLHSYTDRKPIVCGRGTTVGEVMQSLDEQFPGIAFRVIDEQDRIRPHMHVFVGEEAAESPATPVREGQELYIVGALSGG